MIIVGGDFSILLDFPVLRQLYWLVNTPPHPLFCGINGLAGTSRQNIPSTGVARTLPDPKDLQNKIPPIIDSLEQATLTKLYTDNHSSYSP